MMGPDSFLRRLARMPIWILLGFREPPTQVTRAETVALSRWARGRERLVELGVEYGVTSKRIRDVMHPDGVLWLIDPYTVGGRTWLRLDTPRRVARRNVASVHNGAVHWVEGFSVEVGETWREPLDFIFVDADHSYDAVKLDWETWSPHVVPGGVVAFHDTHDMNGPGRLVEELFLDGHLEDWAVRERVDSLFVVQRLSTGCAATPVRG